MVGSLLLFVEQNPFDIGTRLNMAAESAENADSNDQLIYAVAFASIIEMWHAATLCADDPFDCPVGSMISFAVAAGCVSLVFCLVFAFVSALKPYTRYLAIFLALWWLCCVFTLTMPNDREWSDLLEDKDTYGNGVFLTTSNGFIACWAAMILSCALAAGSVPSAPEETVKAPVGATPDGHHSDVAATEAVEVDVKAEEAKDFEETGADGAEPAE